MQKKKKKYSCFGFDLAHMIKVPMISDPTAGPKIFSNYIHININSYFSIINDGKI